jgi:outer membrane protein assembly factor BamB
VNKQTVVFGGCDEKLHLVSAADGSKFGEVATGSYIPGSAALRGDRAYVGNYEGRFMAVSLEEQRILWIYGKEGRQDAFFSSPAVSEKDVVVGCRDGYLYCLNRLTGTMRWRFKSLDEIDSSPVIADDKVIFGSTDGRLYMLDLKTGKRIWHYEIGSAILGSAAVAAGYVFIGAIDGKVYAFKEK